MAHQFITTSITDQLVNTLLKDSGSLSMRIGGLSSDLDWAAAYPDKLQGNNLNIVPETSTSVRVKAGTIWDGASAFALASDFVVSPLTAALPNHLYAVDAGGGAISVQKVASFTPVPPGGTIKEIGVVYVDFAGKVFKITTIPGLVNQIASATPAIAAIGWNKLTPPSSGPFGASNATNAIQVTASFDLVGSYKVGEFALLTGASVPSPEVAIPSTIIAYLAQDTQTAVADALLNVTWNLVVNSPTAFY